jgi:hypothetical protein
MIPRVEQYPEGLNWRGSFPSDKIAHHFKKLEPLCPFRYRQKRFHLNECGSWHRCQVRCEDDTKMADKKEARTGSEIRKAAAAWHGVSLSEKRAQQIAEELNALNATTRQAAKRLRYDDEPDVLAGVLGRYSGAGQ